MRLNPSGVAGGQTSVAVGWVSTLASECLPTPPIVSASPRELRENGQQVRPALVADGHEVGVGVLAEAVGQLTELDLHRHARDGIAPAATDGCSHDRSVMKTPIGRQA